MDVSASLALWCGSRGASRFIWISLGVFRAPRGRQRCSGCSESCLTLSPCDLSWEPNPESLDVFCSSGFPMKVDTSSVLVLPRTAGSVVICEFCLTDKLWWDTRLNDLDLAFRRIGRTTFLRPFRHHSLLSVWKKVMAAGKCGVVRDVKPMPQVVPFVTCGNCLWPTCLRVDSWIRRTQFESSDPK